MTPAWTVTLTPKSSCACSPSATGQSLPHPQPPAPPRQTLLYSQSWAPVPPQQRCAVHTAAALRSDLGPDPSPRGPSRLDPRALGALFAFGAVVGPLVDGIHNQAILVYETLPVALGPEGGPGLRTSLLIPPLLGVAYAVIGGALPALVSSVIPGALVPRPTPFLPRALAPLPRAVAAVLSTCAIIKLSELLVVAALPAPSPLLILFAAAVAQWYLLDGRPAILALALVVAIGGPLCELPLMAAGCWHYLSPDYWPLAAVGFGPEQLPGSAWAGLLSLTAPCYFAVTTDAVALGDYFARQVEEE